MHQQVDLTGRLHRGLEFIGVVASATTKRAPISSAASRSGSSRLAVRTTS